ncbi:MAG: glycosyltransferase [Prevotella sp.]|nr:glycosyltransferase [Prevotella sp.]
MQPTISVIMPFYNRADVLAATLDSILAQTYTDFELIGVDDGSTDHAPAIFQDYAHRDPRLRLFHKPHTNAGEARNFGYERSRGDYLFFLDADDLFEPDFFATMLTTLQQENSDLAVCTADEFDHQTGEVVAARNFRHVNFTQTITTVAPYDLRPHFFTVLLPAAWNRIFKRALIEQYHLRFQSLTNSNDMYFTFTYLLNAQRVTFINRILIHHRVNDQRSLSNPTNRNVDRFDRCRALDYFHQQLPPQTFEQLAPEYYGYYFLKSLDGIRRSDFQHGQRIFDHTRQILGDYLNLALQKNPMKRQFLIALRNNDFTSIYQWLWENHELKFFDLTAPIRNVQDAAN